MYEIKADVAIKLSELMISSLQYYEMSYGLNVEMHKQTEICKRLDAIIRTGDVQAGGMLAQRQATHKGQGSRARNRLSLEEEGHISISISVRGWLLGSSDLDRSIEITMSSI